MDQIQDISKNSDFNYNLDCNIKMILNQTNYSREEAIEKLNLLKDPINVIREYISPNETKDGKNESQEKKINSINQEIYKQIREEFYQNKLNSIKY